MIFKNHFEIFFFLVSTLNSMGVVLCSIIVSERFKIRKSLEINYWQDTVSGVEDDNNVIKSINFEKFRLVLSFCTVFQFNTIFFNSSKYKLAKIWGEAASPPAPFLPPRFLRAWSVFYTYVSCTYISVRESMKQIPVFMSIFCNTWVINTRSILNTLSSIYDGA